MRAEQDFFSSEEQEITTQATHAFCFSFSLHHQAGNFHMEGGLHMQQHTTVVPPRASRTAFPKTQTDDLPRNYERDDDKTVLRPPTSARRYHIPGSTQAPLPLAPTQYQTTQALPSPLSHWQKVKRALLKGLLVVLFLGLAADTLGYAAWKHWQYGDYPTSHTSANFGHGGTSDLIAFTSGQEVEIIEFVGKKANLYAVKLQGASGHRLVTLDVLDVNGDGKLDILVNIEDVAQRPCLLNTGSAFVWSVTR